MKKIFICYSQQNQPAFEQIQAHLENTGLEILHSPVERYREAACKLDVARWLAASDAFVLLWSSESALSNFVDLEWHLASYYEVPVYGVILDQTPIRQDLPPPLKVLTADALTLATFSKFATPSREIVSEKYHELERRFAKVAETKPVQLLAILKPLFEKYGLISGAQSHPAHYAIEDLESKPKGLKLYKP